MRNGDDIDENGVSCRGKMGVGGSSVEINDRRRQPIGLGAATAAIMEMSLYVIKMDGDNYLHGAWAAAKMAQNSQLLTLMALLRRGNEKASFQQMGGDGGAARACGAAAGRS